MKKAYDSYHINFFKPSNQNLNQVDEVFYQTQWNMQTPLINHDSATTFDKLHKRLKEIKKIDPADIFKSGVIDSKISTPKPKKLFIIDETVRRFDIHQSKKGLSQTGEKRKSVSLQILLKDITIEKKKDNQDSPIQMFQSKFPLMYCTSHSPQSANKAKNEGNFKAPYPMKFFNDNQVNTIKLVQIPYSPARVFQASVEKPKIIKHKSTYSVIEDYNKTPLLSSINQSVSKKESLNSTFFKEFDDSIKNRSKSLHKLDASKIIIKGGNATKTIFGKNSLISDKKNVNHGQSFSSQQILPSSLSLEKLAKISDDKPKILKIKIPQINAKGHCYKGQLSQISDDKKSRIFPFQRYINDSFIIQRKGGFIKSDINTVELTREKVMLGGPPKNPIYNPPTIVHFHIDEANDNSSLKEKLAKFRTKLLHCLKYTKFLKLTIWEIVDNPRIFSQKPFEKKGSHELFEAIKKEDVEEVRYLLKRYSKYLVYDFNNIYQTGLHLACKKGLYEIAKILIDHGADINAVDLIGRSPLYFAIKNQRLNIIKVRFQIKNKEILTLLLYSECDPWSVDYRSFGQNNRLIKYFLTRARQINIAMKMKKNPIERRKYWEKERETLLNDPIDID